ncbi:MAG: SsrA-binding protein SmpB [Dehalococcoidia bacterium]|nr:SsrA-binding protein SmpB [Dehalococcoidia bacterium]
MGDSTIALNRRARYDYEILERYEAGIVLTGSEVKSLRAHRVSLQGAFARMKDNELWLVDAHIAPYENAGYTGHNPTRDRKLLLHKKELARLAEMTAEKGLTIVPLAMYFKRGNVKVELGVVRGLKKYDKREKVKEREQQLEMARAVRRDT